MGVFTLFGEANFPLLSRFMNSKIFTTLALLICFCGSAAHAQKRRAPALKTALSVSDIHFNPFYDPSLVDTLVKSPVSNWGSIFESSAIQSPNGYGADANYPLLRSAMSAMQQQDSLPQMVLITGDFLCHNFQSIYSQYAGAYPDSLESFTARTIQFIAGYFDRTFPHTVVLAALGNNDSYCGDYNISPNSAFLKMFAQAWAPLLRNRYASEDSIFISSFSHGGYYEHRLAGGRASLLVLNTVFFSAKYTNACEAGAANPVRDELKWLKKTLQANSMKKRPVWMAYHIPPGIDVHSTLHSKARDCSSAVTLMMTDSANGELLKLLKHYAAFIRFGIAGHTHMDDLRVVYKDSVPASCISITPAISPLFGNNPAFKVLSFNSRTMSLVNYRTIYLGLNNQTQGWTLEYDFQKAYQVNGINPLSLSRVRQKIAADTLYRGRYIQYYTAGNPASGEITNKNWKAFGCGTGCLTKKEFVSCYCK